ncbi:receptor-type tyrosine-protein phosphatase T isoform X2 [Patella vulgata]|uniref:receptor-type tyrosine-protein phosphatase T isoform X2 n=2 Tax=Patella vulgata TaxID=6465 RepID=UPI00217FD086|nr:receptor-type tyrosine-protein phosphatase T isoform X2 [Patella vulgata]
MAESLTVKGLIFILLTISTESSQSCPKGRFGWKCRFFCQCADNKECDVLTGACPSGCQSNKYGINCQYNNTCLYDRRGVNYTGSLNEIAPNITCLNWTKVKDSGVYTDFNIDDFPDNDVNHNYCRNPGDKDFTDLPWCYVEKKDGSITYKKCDALKVCECPNYLYGASCLKECHCKNISEICDKEIGTCESGCAPGWIGTLCDIPCPKGKYGINCENLCGHCLNDNCHSETGRCLDKCKSGYYGTKCTKVCPGKYYGPNCMNDCGHCGDNDTCDHVTGACFRSCESGYTGQQDGCHEQCPANYYGIMCKQPCGLCKYGVTCHHVSGICENGCQSGSLGQHCNKSCETGWYGENCSFTCGNCKLGKPCNRITGQCSQGCAEGFIGYRCAEVLQVNLKSSVVGGVVAAVVVFIIILILIILFLRNRKRKRMNIAKPFSKDGIQEEELQIQGMETCQLLGDSRLGDDQTVLSEHVDNQINEEIISEPIYMNVNNTKKQSSPVMLSQLYDYIKKNKENNFYGFKREFEELPVGLLACCEVSRRPDNRAKNRYGNIVAYDHSRVVLDPIPGEQNTDYVNANYMDGYNRKKAFIASQGPNKTMIRDFWRMVWQLKISKIVMLTNLVEACKRKCEQYWPEEGSIKYGEVTVKLVHTKKYTDYIIRTFEISKEEISKIVKQFHFTTWSDHGAPTYPTTLLAFRRKVLMYNTDSTAPILCHCSAGIGRTGTYIALDYLLDQAQREDFVDVLYIAQVMRTNRVNMIQTWEQYVFVYDAVLEAVKSGNTTISRSAFRTVYQDMCTATNEGDKTELEKQYNVLQLLSPNIEKDECSAALTQENILKNRFKNILPANRCRPFLYTPVDDCNDYINAVFLPGHTQKDHFIITQMPLPNTVADFWRMLYDYNSDTVVMLNEFERNDSSCALYWPVEYGYSEEYGQLSVELLSSSEVDPDVTMHLCQLSHKGKGEERAVKQFLFKSWPDYQTTPNSTTSLLRLHKLVTESLKQNGKGPVTIHCMNGASKSGLFSAICIILERLDIDHEVDVYQSMKQIRMNRPQFIENIEQFQFCYQAVMEYIDSQ